jgi:hypothetical protein
MQCPSGKHRHPSKGAAEAHLRSLLRVEPEYRGHVYPCIECREWHVGRLKKNAHVNKFQIS